MQQEFGQLAIRGEELRITAKGVQLTIPKEVAELLYVWDGDPAEVQSGFGISFSLNVFTSELEFRDLSQSEPSTISIRLQIHRPSSGSNIPAPDYFPSYSQLSPEQRWVYLDWLCHRTAPIDVGYVFLYYYGLERQLLTGNFDAAFNEILLLREHHKTSSFPWYSIHALIYSCIFRNRADRLRDIGVQMRWAEFRDAGLLVAFALNLDLSAVDLADLTTAIPGANRRYLKLARPEYESALEAQLRERYGVPMFPFARKYDLGSLPKTQSLLFANISLPDSVRSPEIPSFLNHLDFVSEIATILLAAHLEVKESRRNKKSQAPTKGSP